jgi:protoporphyrinogen oxidase
MERFYGLPSEQIEREFAEKRMTWIARSASPASIARRLSGLLRNAPPAAQSRDLVRPKRGFSAIYDTVRASLEAGGAEFELGRELGGIRREDGTFVIEGSDGFSVRTERLISTIPVQECLRLCRLPVRSALVETSTLVSLCFSFAGQREFGSTILYNFSHSGDWKRITMASAFYGTIEGREYFTVEINRNASAGAISLEEEERAFRRDAAQKKLFIGDLRLETSHVLENAYPVYRFGATAAAAEAVKHLADFGVESFGRQGGFDYLPNTRDVIETAERRLSVRSTRLYA